MNLNNHKYLTQKLKKFFFYTGNLNKRQLQYNILFKKQIVMERKRARSIDVTEVLKDQKLLQTLKKLILNDDFDVLGMNDAFAKMKFDKDSLHFS